MVPETVKTYLSSLRGGYLYSVLFCALLLFNSCTTENSLDINANVPSASNAGNYLTGRLAYNNHDLKTKTNHLNGDKDHCDAQVTRLLASFEDRIVAARDLFELAHEE